jgi:hypothetical protein
MKCRRIILVLLCAGLTPLSIKASVNPYTLSGPLAALMRLFYRIDQLSHMRTIPKKGVQYTRKLHHLADAASMVTLAEMIEAGHTLWLTGQMHETTTTLNELHKSYGYIAVPLAEQDESFVLKPSSWAQVVRLTRIMFFDSPVAGIQHKRGRPTLVKLSPLQQLTWLACSVLECAATLHYFWLPMEAENLPLQQMTCQLIRGAATRGLRILGGDQLSWPEMILYAAEVGGVMLGGIKEKEWVDYAKTAAAEVGGVMLGGIKEEEWLENAKTAMERRFVSHLRKSLPEGEECCICLSENNCRNPSLYFACNNNNEALPTEETPEARKGEGFHYTCIPCLRKWFKGQQPSCPICQVKLTEIYPIDFFKTAQKLYNTYHPSPNT